MTRTLRTLLLIASTAACATDPVRVADDATGQASIVSVRPAVGESFRLRVGQAASIGGGKLLVTLQGVASDSRCPSDVNCAWAGDAVVKIGTTVGKRVWSWTELHTGLEPRQVEAGDHLVTLVALEPNTRQGVQIPQEDYVAVLRVTRR